MSKPKLALIPSGYKSGKVYSILPNDATGDFDFTRQSIGTRVRKDGLIEEAKTSGSITNLQSRSEEFDNSVWTKTRTTITADQELAPDGTNTADKLTGDGTGTSYVYDALNFTYPQKYTISIFVKSINVTTFSIQKFAGGTGVAFFDLSTGTISSAPTGTMSNPIIESLSNGWFRCSVEHIPTTTGSQNYGFGMQDYNGDQFYIWGAMVSEGALSDYIKTEGTTETKTVETFTDVPRLDWLNSNCPSLLLEPQRTNLQVYSEQFDNAAWGKSNSTIEANTIISPNGELSADKLVDTTTSAAKYIQDVASGLSTSSKATFSIFLKQSELSQVELLCAQNFSPFTNWARCRFDVSTLSDLGTTIGDFAYEDFGNGWVRLGITGTPTSTSAIIRVTLSKDGTNGYAGTGTEGIYIFGAQVEQGDYASSYIKTEASTVTRLKDDCHLLNHTLFTDYPFTVYAKAKIEDVGNTIFSIYGGASNKYLAFLLPSSGVTAAVYRRDATNNDSDFYNFTYSVGDTIKVAVAFINDTTYKLYINGTEIANVTSGLSVPFDNNDILLGQFRISGDDGKRNSIDDFRVYDYTLTDAELTEITTL